MGAGQSGGVEIGGSSMGYQVLRVYPNSPGSRAGLKAYFDFIIAIGNTRFNKENGSLREILKASVDQKLKVVVFNTRTKDAREVEIVPSSSWGGNGLLGVSIKHSSFDKADERVWHVVEVEPASPAHQAGLKSGEDFVIGSDSILQENDDLYNLIEAHDGKALKLFVYNVSNDNCREVICHPNSKWGGRGYLGCEFGHGLLHRIPYGEKGNNSDNPRASLLKNEQPAAVYDTVRQNSNSSSFQNQLMQHQIQQLQRPNQPGQQLLHQALLDQKSPHQQQQPQQNQQSQSYQQQQQLQPKPEHHTEKVLPPPPQAPQTFAQLANAQYQSTQHPASQHQANPYQMPQQYNFQQQQSNPYPMSSQYHVPQQQPNQFQQFNQSQQSPQQHLTVADQTGTPDYLGPPTSPPQQHLHVEAPPPTQNQTAPPMAPQHQTLPPPSSPNQYHQQPQIVPQNQAAPAPSYTYQMGQPLLQQFQNMSPPPPIQQQQQQQQQQQAFQSLQQLPPQVSADNNPAQINFRSLCEERGTN